jgi:arabinogalactan oligomer/maltooligosaccharide transport system permease protein
MRNSVMIASINAVLQLAIGATAAYALSRFRYRGRKTTLMTILIIQMFPQLLAVTAFYVILADLRESIPFMDFGSPIALLVIFAGGALGINAWMLKGFFDSIPSEIDESAKIDGASHGQIYVRIILPLALPMLAVVALLSFIGTMNEFLLTAVILGGNQEAITLAPIYRDRFPGELGSFRGRRPYRNSSCHDPLYLAPEICGLRTYRWITQGLISDLPAS